ncbi:hypothetical protein [Paraburkholderia sp. BR10954]|uniref:hypothetical protein n=1 Tax=Paraburkholderia sp. BR10954 TaxID=3236995 RepID=UPI0034D37EB0
MGTRRPSFERLLIIMERQRDPGWGSEYQPAIRAVRGEAPNISHALTFRAMKVPGRDIHVLSAQESHALLLALYHPGVVGVQEQLAMMPHGRPHPLHNFPGAIAGKLAPLRGIVDVAERLGYTHLLPRVWGPGPGGRPCELVFPYVGDFLLAFCKPEGDYCCINWSVKDSEIRFKRPIGTGKRRDQFPESLLPRHELECTYYADAAIRTILLASDLIDWNVRANLRQLFLHHCREVSLSGDEQAELLARFHHCLETETPPSELIFRLTGAGKYSVDDCRNVLFQGIWFRKLRVDLFQPVLIDRPLRPEMQDVLVKYADWFSESPC